MPNCLTLATLLPKVSHVFERRPPNRGQHIIYIYIYILYMLYIIYVEGKYRLNCPTNPGFEGKTPDFHISKMNLIDLI